MTLREIEETAPLCSLCKKRPAGIIVETSKTQTILCGVCYGARTEEAKKLWNRCAKRTGARKA